MVDQHVEGAASTVTTLAIVRIEADERSTPTIWLAVTGSTR